MDLATCFAGLSQDLRYAWRVLVREPGFSFITVATIALGIGATTALFSVADTVLLRPLPWPEPDRLVRLEERRGGLISRRPWMITNGTYNAWAESAGAVESAGAWITQVYTLRGLGDPERLSVALTTPGIFSVLKARPAFGRLFVDEDAEFGRAGTAILSQSLWRRRFGGDRNAVGRPIELDGQTFQIVGVMPEGFAFPDRDTQAWLVFRPLPLLNASGTQMRLMMVNAIARLKEDATIPEAAGEATARARTVPDIRDAALALFGSRGEVSVAVAPALDIITAESRPAMLLLLAAVGLLMIAATASVVSVQFARAAARRREIAVRAAIGAGRARLVRHALVESALLGCCAGALGLAIAAALCQALPSLLPADLPRIDALTVDARGAAVALALTVLVSVIAGLAPSALSKPALLAGALTEESGAPIGAAFRTRVGRLRAAIIVGQVAIACVLLAGGALLARSFNAMVQADRGYDPSGLLTAKLTFPDNHGSDGIEQVRVLETLDERLRSMPGVVRVAFGNGLPLVSQGFAFGQVIPAPHDPTQKVQVSATWRLVSSEYFEALGMRLRAGAPLAHDLPIAGVAPIVVNQSFAREYLGPVPVGQRLRLGLSSRPEWEVVGVVDDVQQGSVGEPTRPEFFLSYRDLPDRIPFDPMLLIRFTDDRIVDADTLRAMVRELNPAVVVDSIVTMEDRVMTSLAKPRAYAVVLGGLAALALAIAAVGLFGVLSYTIAQRTREIGVRIALGAQRRDIARLVFRQVAITVGLGVAIGVMVTAVGAGSLSTFLYGIVPHDPMSFAGAILGIVVVTALACAVPLRRALTVDPIRALRAR